MKTNWLALLGFMLVLSGGLLHSQERMTVQERVTVDPVNDLTVSLGHSVPVEFKVHIKPGFHVNSHQPAAPELIPTEMTFSPPENLVIAKVKYPAGELLSLPFDPTTKLSVYSGDFTIQGVVLPQHKAVAGSYTVHAELKYQACDNSACYPPKKVPVSFNVQVRKSAGSH